MKSLILIISILIVTQYAFSQDEKWVAPEDANEVKNPIEKSVKVVAKGKNLYLKNCMFCHGEKGEGDGEAVAVLPVKPANFTLDEFRNQTDGSVFWKITTGKSPMARFKGALEDEEIWHIIHYLRTLSEPVNPAVKVSN